MRERWLKERIVSLPNQRWLRSSSGFFIGPAPSSVRRDLAHFDDLLPARELRRLEGRELLGRVADDLEAQLEQLRLDRGIVQRRHDGVAKLRLDVGGQSPGRREGLPRVDGHALEA